MKAKIFILGSFILLLLSCGTSKNAPTEAEVAKLEGLIDSKQIIIESDWAYPQATMAMQQIANTGLLQPGNSAANISLVGNHNFLKIKGDSITSYLPYFGERQMQIDYGGMDSAIEFNGLMKDYKVEKNKKHGYNITFEAKSNNENFQVFLSISPNLKSEMTLSGTGRFPIRYSGHAEKITERDGQ